MRTIRTITASLAAVVGIAALAGPAAAAATTPATSPAPMLARGTAALSGVFDRAVRFRNSTDQTVWVAIMRYDPDGCGDYGNWQTKGWWRLNPGDVKQAFTTSNRYAGYYAKAADGTEWSGSYGHVYIYHSSFDSCLKIGSSDAYDTVGMRRLVLRGSTAVPFPGPYTVNLT